MKWYHCHLTILPMYCSDCDGCETILCRHCFLYSNDVLTQFQAPLYKMFKNFQFIANAEPKCLFVIGYAIYWQIFAIHIELKGEIKA